MDISVPCCCYQYNLKMSLEFFLFFYFFYKWHIHFWNLYLILKESKSANHLIFLDCLTAMKIVVLENFDFQYSKNFLRIRFFGIELK